MSTVLPHGTQSSNLCPTTTEFSAHAHEGGRQTGDGVEQDHLEFEVTNMIRGSIRHEASKLSYGGCLDEKNTSAV